MLLTSIGIQCIDKKGQDNNKKSLVKNSKDDIHVFSYVDLTFLYGPPCIEVFSFFNKVFVIVGRTHHSSHVLFYL